MQVLRVGGCVRDELLGKNPKDIDYVVVGSSEEELLSLGYTRVGLSFPVFLHPDTNEEHALARQERLSDGKFKLNINNVTLEEDLLRRDLTINSIAMDSLGNIIDPYFGCKDLSARILRATSEAFKEDPLRLLRVARFKATLNGDWKINSDIFQYAKELKPMLSTLTKERVHLEMTKVFQGTDTPSVYFRTLLKLDILDVLYPMLYDMVSVEHNNPYHMEGSVFNHVMMVLDACKSSPARIASLFHDIGKVPCFLEKGKFHSHEDEIYIRPTFDYIKENYKFTTMEYEIAEFVALNHHKFQNFIDGTSKEKSILKLLMSIRTQEKLEYILETVYADMLGRYGIKKPILYTKESIVILYNRIKKVKVDLTGLNTNAIIQKLHSERLHIVKGFIE